jgi:hypothetical protein
MHTVQPMLKDGRWDSRSIAGLVKADFANIFHISALCDTPITTDEAAGATTCLQIEHAGNAYHSMPPYVNITVDSEC